MRSILTPEDWQAAAALCTFPVHSGSGPKDNDLPEDGSIRDWFSICASSMLACVPSHTGDVAVYVPGSCRPTQRFSCKGITLLQRDYHTQKVRTHPFIPWASKRAAATSVLSIYGATSCPIQLPDC